MIRKLAILSVLLLATACVPPIVVTAPQEPIQVGFYNVTPQIEWNRPTFTQFESWTVDGYALQALRFHEVPDGETLFLEENKDGKIPAFRKAMLANEIQEFVVATYAGDGWANIKPSGLQPVKFGSTPGFRFSMSMQSDDGLDYLATAYGCVKDDTLHLILYSGTALHYYPKNADAVEKLFASIRG